MRPGRPPKGNVTELATKLGESHDALEQQGSSLCTAVHRVQELSEALTSAVAEITMLKRDTMSRASVDDLACTHEAEMHAVVSWYRAHDYSDRAQLLMQPDSLEQEYYRFQMWMPGYMSHLWATHTSRHSRAKIPTHPGHLKWQKKIQARVHTAAARALHSRDEQCMPTILLAKSLDRYYQHVRACTHSQDVKLGEDLTHGVIDRLRTELSSWIPRVPYQKMVQLRLMWLDNWDMYAAVVHARRKEGQVVKSKMLHAILLAEEVLDASLFTGASPTWSLWKPADESTWDIMKSVHSQSEVDAHLGGYFTNFFLMAKDNLKSLWARPPPACDNQTATASVVIDWPAQTHLSASSKEDMAEVYEWLDEQMPGVFKVVVEDWATAAITWNFIHRSFDVYRHWMVWGCELHRQFHTNDAIVIIYWEHVIKPAAVLLDRSDIKVKFNANDFNNRDQFVRLVAVAGFKWLTELDGLPLNVIASPTTLLDAVSENLPALELIHFILYGGTFALADKAAMRCSIAEDLDWAWPYTSMLGRASGKTNYAKYGIMMNKMIEDSHPWVRVLLTKYRTHRATSRPCTGVGKGSAIEAVSRCACVPCIPHLCDL